MTAASPPVRDLLHEFSQPLAQTLFGPVETGFYAARGATGDRSNLLIREAFVVVQQYRCLQLVWQLVDGLHQLMQRFVALYIFIHPRSISGQPIR